MANTELIKKLRDMTQAGVMDVMKALKENNDDLDKAAQWLREKGIAKASKKSGAIVTEGIVKALVRDNYSVIIEINSQTDFVAKNDQFVSFVSDLCKQVEICKPKNLDAIEQLKLSNGKTVHDECINLTAVTGEKIVVRRATIVEKANDEMFQIYEHFNNKIAVIVKFSNNINHETAKQIAMHIAAMNPKFVSIKNADQEWIKNETEILKKQTLAEGKPADRVDMIVKGRINKSLAEVCLEEQNFISDPSKKIKDLLNENKSTIAQFIRFEVGEGIEKKTSNFVDEVMQQMR